MQKMIINDRQVEFEEGKTILEVARSIGVEIPTLCALKDDVCNLGRCGICVVEVEGMKMLPRACIIKAKDGMVVNTQSEATIAKRNEMLQNTLDTHEFKCGPCSRRLNCELLDISKQFKIFPKKKFETNDRQALIDDRSESLVIDRAKCIKCNRCVSACKVRTTTESIVFEKNEAGERIISPKGGKCFDHLGCLLCGQCLIACPVNCLQEKSHIDKVKEALADESKHVIVAMAPAARTSMGELFGMGYGVDTTGKLYSAFRKLGFDKVFDMNFGADMTIMEETTEFLKRVDNNGPFPMMTSCCPSWVRLVENHHPEFINNLSSAKSPQQEFGAASKTYYPKLVGLNPKDIFTVTIMPCISKKYEASRDEMESDGIRDIDAVLTVRELASLIKAEKIDFVNLEDGISDPAMGEYTGAGAIFGATGGVMEAALRTAKDFVERKDLENIEYKALRGTADIKEAIVNIGNIDYKIAVINGASSFFKFVQEGKMNEGYHFIEVMSCTGGCVNGGGQPHVKAKDREKMDIRKIRASVLYNQDLKKLPKRKSHQNKSLQKMYVNFMGVPGGELAEKLLHTSYIDRKNK
ncbi:ferredoxin hydrogenase [uncultured Clostridium sp.]|uniref:ferredoxin hydrogenase n=1 Tax=uncultured Clostridium sp. TaxID=59620 RepID=UPI00262EC689|nr:ferredoxin hydrogenase [uncultured Clostridium sp.]